ncbi:hypothetical protein K493DRAFT_332946 [Basidiobolus meristosporus CBS 931.73]|uniref:RNI-like protein n=1 Tax=Basidiobolus meristosporus CBS 931.73 TaxID=1314790 RepID=A0A1Y1Z9D8_9FUNG|nr:hypothetical protein K493DRAFT_332946 [Basidiobolus meristosporus CBS 931.73]|eukprot:ORY06796.1 hypothetical protein K493DRAFT_332946 [Basidiobolus meristosporus CBS 931.73]
MTLRRWLIIGIDHVIISKYAAAGQGKGATAFNESYVAHGVHLRNLEVPERRQEHTLSLFSVKAVDSKRIAQFLRTLYACLYPDSLPAPELEELLHISTIGRLTTNYLSLVKSIDLNTFGNLVNRLLPGDTSQSIKPRVPVMFELRVLWKIYRERYANTNLQLLSWNGCFPLDDLIGGSRPYSSLNSIQLDWLNADCTFHAEELLAVCRMAPKLTDLHIRVRSSKGNFTSVLVDFLQNAYTNTIQSIVLEGLPLDIEALLVALLRNHRLSLSRLDLIGYNLRLVPLEALARFPKLSKISLASCRGVNNTQLGQISQCARLEDIDLSRTDVTLLGFSELLKHVGPRLRSLRLNHLSMNLPNALENVSKYCVELAHLELRRTVYNCHRVPQLILGCPQLESLYLGDEVGNPPSSINTMVESIFRSGNKLKYLDLGYCHLTFSVLPLMMLKTGLNIVGPIRCVGVEVANLPGQGVGSMSDTRLQGVMADVYYDFAEGAELPVAVFPPTFFTKPYHK